MNNNLQNNTVDISFCLPVYNVKNYLNNCLKSIIEQNLANITYEIFCIDDCSTDGSYEWLMEQVDSIPQLRVQKNESNRGVSYTRNRLVKEARGKYIWFIDPDDMMIKNIAYQFYELAEKYNADVLLGDYIRVPENEGFDPDKTYTEQTQIVIVPLDKNLPKDQNGKIMCAIWAGIFSREFIVKNNLTMNEKMIAQEDTLFYYEFSLKKGNCYKCNLNCYLYRQRESSIMHIHSDEKNRKYYESMLEMLRVYKEHLNNEDYDNLESIKRKIHHSQQNVVVCLASLRCKKYIKQQLKILKELKVYPYKFRKEELKRKPFYMGLLTYLLPLKPFFWLYHFVYMLSHKDKK